MTVEELINKLQAMVDNGTMSPNIEVIVLHPGFDEISSVEIYHPITPSYNAIYLRLI